MSLKDTIKRNPKPVAIAIAVAVLGVVIWLSPSNDRVQKPEEKKEVQIPTSIGVLTGESGIKAYVGEMEQRQEKQKLELEEQKRRSENLEKQLLDIQKKGIRAGEPTPEMKAMIEQMKRGQPGQLGIAGGEGRPEPREERLIKISLRRDKKADEREGADPAVAGKDRKAPKLPAGTVVEGKLLTGVFAVSGSSYPLPVAVQVLADGVGPNQVRVPLRGCLMSGKAWGDIVSERAQFKMDTLTCVKPDGEVVEKTEGKDGFIGYLYGGSYNGEGRVSEGAVFGVPGQIVRRTGEYLTKVFLTSFLSSFSSALAVTQTVTNMTPLGGASSVVVGGQGQYATMSGLSGAMAKMAEYYATQLQTLIPAVYVEPGVPVSIVVRGTVSPFEFIEMPGDVKGGVHAGLD